MKLQKDSCIKWLKDNNYHDVAQLILDLMYSWEKAGNKQRRSWWEILAGDKNGNSRIINNIKIPVLKAAQIRMKKPVTSNAICRNKNEILPPMRLNNRWK